MSLRRPRLLLVTPHPIWPPTHGWAVRLWNLLPRLAREFEIRALVFSGGTDDAGQRQALAAWCSEVYFQQFRAPSLQDAALPVAARHLVWPELGERVRALLSAHRIDLLQLEGTELVGLLPSLPGVPVVVTAHDLGFETQLRRWWARLGRYGAGVSRAPRLGACLELARYELAGLARADQIHCMSEANARLLGRAAPGLRAKVRVVPNGVDTAAMTPPGDAARARRDVLLLGSFPHAPNLDAVEFFLAEIWPRVRRALPSARVTLAGASPPDWIAALDGEEGVVVAGEVADVRPLLWRHAVLAVPLRAGSGTRIKILEAMGAGLPVLATRIGAAGLGAKAGEAIEIASGASRFAARLIRMLGDPEGSAGLARRGREFVIARYDWELVTRRCATALGELLPAAASPEMPEPAPSAALDAPVDLIVPWRPGASMAKGLCESLRSLDYHLPFRVRFVAAAEPPASLRAETSAHGFEWELFDRFPASLGELLDAAIEASRAELLAILDPRDVPTSAFWLGHLLWALQQPAPPAAVLGEILAPGASPVDRESIAAGEGFAFRFSNLAVRRAVWSARPFGARADAERRWPQAVVGAHLFVLSSPDAPVERSEDASLTATVELTAGSRIEASVVVCTRERGAALAETLRAMARQEAPFPWELLVIDNGSRDGSLELARALERELAPRLRVVSEPVLGLSTARNAGIQAARSDRILFLDDDAVPWEGWLTALAAALDEPEVLEAGGPIEPAWMGARPVWLEDRYLPYLSSWDRGAEAHDLRYNELPRGTNMGFRREAFLRCGEFSRHLGRRGRSLRSCEETELGLRLERAGARVRYAPAAGVRHRVEAGRLSERWMVARFAAQGESEAIVDWMHWGLWGLRQGTRAARERLATAALEQGPGAILWGNCHRAAARAYLWGAVLALLTVPRLPSAWLSGEKS